MPPSQKLPPTAPQPLHSLLLIAKTRSGPRLVAYYPPTTPAHHPFFDRHADDADSDSDSELEHGSEEEEEDLGEGSISGAENVDVREEDQLHASGKKQLRGGRRLRSILETLPPFIDGADSATGVDRKTESLARLLAPSSRVWHKKRFEVAVDGVLFLGCPVFEREGGGWGGCKRRGNRNKEKKDEEQAGQGDGGNDEDDIVAEEDDEEDEEEDEDAVQASLKVTDSVDINQDASRDLEDRQSDRSPKAAEGSTEQSPQASTFDNSYSTSSMRSSFIVGPNNSSGPEPLTMFNLVFALQPSLAAPADYQDTVQDIYANIVKQLSKALAYQQKRRGFVWTETRLITDLLSRLGESITGQQNGNGHGLSSFSPSSSSYAAQWPQLAAKSDLAKAMESVYECVSKGEIAHLTLGPGLSLSLQIPLQSKTAQVPTPMEPNSDGALWLTTFDASTNESLSNSGRAKIDSAGQREPSSATGAGISPYSALLLLQDSETLAREIALQPTTELSTPLTRYIRHSVPTKSLVQLSRVMKFSLQDIQLLSLHLIHYRRAIAIPPLNTSHTYVVSPNADFRRLPQASQEFGKRFAMLPSLVSILSKMSAGRTSMMGQGPQVWNSMIPSSDHKAAYMEVLEWLMRGGWVTQLRTFCWVRVSAEVKAKVARQMRKEEREAASAAEAMTALVSEEELEEDLSDTGGEQRRNSSGESFDGPAAALSPRLRAHLAPPRPPSETGSTSTARTAVRITNLKPTALKGSSGYDGAYSHMSIASHAHRISDGSAKSKSALEVTQDDEEPLIEVSEFEPSIVVSPHKADAVESQWLELISSRLPDEDVRGAWPRLVKYFDGRHALEEIAPREGWKRKFVAPLLAKLVREEGLLLTVRHW